MDISAPPQLEFWLRHCYEKQHLVVLKNKSRGSNTGKFKRLTVFPLRRLALRRKIGRWIKKINAEIKEAMELAETIVSLKNLARSSTLQGTRNARGESDALQDIRRNVDTSMFVGRESDVDSLVRILCNPSDVSRGCLSVVAIVGLGGMGKTSLAKQIYENKQVTSYFNERIWITVSQDFNIEKNLNQMVEFLKEGHNESVSGDISIRKLEKYLAGKSFLLVMDDVWNTNPNSWDAMRNALERIGGSKESMILVTTRDDMVAKTMNAHVHNLSGLLEVDGRHLFEQIAFANMSPYDVSPFKDLANEIYSKCLGVPLAIKAIAGILRLRKEPYEWENIKNSKLWKLHDDTGILPSLKLSYDHLPSPFIKKCFSICAHLAKGYYFEKYEMTDRWIALGLTNHIDTAEEYFDALVSISFILVRYTNELGEATCYVMHDLVYDLARSVAEHEHVYLEVDKEKNNALDIQHLTVIGRAKLLEDITDKELEKLRSLEIFDTLDVSLVPVRYLRVLSLQRTGIEVIPESIGELKCLKFLDLMQNPIKVLPGCITRLYNLQSLLLYDCAQLSGLPQGLSNLVNLSHLGLSFYISPAKGTIRQLTHLQILPPLQLTEGGFAISDLECLNCIRGKLELKGLELIRSKQDIEISNFSKKTRLEELRLQWDDKDSCMNQEEVLSALYPNPNLKVLSIKGYAGEEFPSWLITMSVMKENKTTALNNLQKIELVECRRCSKLPTLGKLPNLKFLVISKLDNLEFITPEFYCGTDILLGNTSKATNSSSGSLVKSKCYFPKLKEFRLCNLPILEEWRKLGGAGTEEWVAFESLKVLVMEDCPMLTTMPDKFPSLQQLTMKSIKSGHPLSQILSNKSTLTSMKNIYIEEIEGLTHLPEMLVEYCTSLLTLTISACFELTCMPECLLKLQSLEELKIRECHSLVSLPSLSGLELSLCELEISCNDGLTSVPEGMQSCYSLETLWFYNNCPKVETLPNLTSLTRLSNLSIQGMTRMISQPPDWMYTLPSLRVLHVGNYDELNEFPDISCLLRITSLKHLHLYGWERIESLPTQLQHFTVLEGLSFYGFKYMESLPNWIQNLSSLQLLGFRWCNKLKELASAEAMNNLTKLVYLEIQGCPLLRENIKAKGTEHHKIPPHVEVNIKDS